MTPEQFGDFVKEMNKLVKMESGPEEKPLSGNALLNAVQSDPAVRIKK